MAMIWPIALVVFSNVVYHICAKSVPKEMDTMASMTIVYLVGAASAAALFFVTNRGGSLSEEFAKMNLAPLLLGVAVVGLEGGYIYAYKNGWAVSMAAVVQSAFLSLALLAAGALLYNEAITLNKVLGICLCLVGLFFLNR